MITANRAREIAKAAIPSSTDSIFLESIYMKIASAAKEGYFSIDICFKDNECLNTSWFANKLREAGFIVNIEEEAIDDDEGWVEYTGNIYWE